MKAMPSITVQHVEATCAHCGMPIKALVSTSTAGVGIFPWYHAATGNEQCVWVPTMEQT